MAHSMIVNNLNVHRTMNRPDKTCSKLIIYPNAVLACSICDKYLQSVSWWDFEVLKRSRSIEHCELSHRNFLNIDEALDSVAIEQPLCISTRKRNDSHTLC
jgi:hypothetical protein